MRALKKGNGYIWQKAQQKPFRTTYRCGWIASLLELNTQFFLIRNIHGLTPLAH